MMGVHACAPHPDQKLGVLCSVADCFVPYFSSKVTLKAWMPYVVARMVLSNHSAQCAR